MTGHAPPPDPRLMAALQEVSKQLPGLETLHRDFVNISQGQFETKLGALGEQLWDCEEDLLRRLHEAIGAQNESQIRQAYGELRAGHTAARQLFSDLIKLGPQSFQEIAKVLDRVLCLLGGRDLAPAMQLREGSVVMAPANETPDVELPSQVILQCDGLTPDEIRAMVLGLQIGVQLALPAPARNFQLPPELHPGELERQIERAREQRKAATDPRVLN
jgi:hypothetical protein